MSFPSVVILFVSYSFIGWAVETVYCSVLSRKFIYRGFLIGPVCPIYGFGALSIIFILSPFEGSPLLVLLFAIIITSAIEYFTSVLLEKLFKKSWWDYSRHKFNINGRVCLQMSAVWGLLAMLLLYVIHPLLKGLLFRMPDTSAQPAALILLLIIGTDLILSVRDALHFNREMLKLTELAGRIERKKDEITSAVGAFGIGQKEKLEQELSVLLDLRDESLAVFFNRMWRILNAFPHMRLHSRDKLSLRERLLSYRWKK